SALDGGARGGKDGGAVGHYHNHKPWKTIRKRRPLDADSALLYTRAFVFVRTKHPCARNRRARPRPRRSPAAGSSLTPRAPWSAASPRLSPCAFAASIGRISRRT